MKRGVLVATDHTLEHLLPMFYLNFRLHSDLPLTFFDFGMSPKGRSFCEQRGPVLSIKESLIKETTPGKKTMWFKKPLAFKQAPYDVNLWLDIDCKIRGPLEPLFEHLKGTHWLAIFEETRLKVNPTFHKDFNSGVVVFFKNSPFISLWETICIKFADILPGDQDALSVLLIGILDKITPLTYRDNHLFRANYDLTFEQSHVIHYHGSSKKTLKNELLILQHRTLHHLRNRPHNVSRVWIAAQSIKRGVLVATDHTLEHLLPMFYLNFRLHSDLPLTFFDFGMSPKGRSFCEQRGPVLSIKESLIKETTSRQKTMWFKKPLAFKQAPYGVNLWLDIDCKVTRALEPLFEHLQKPHWLAIFEEMGGPVKNHRNFNSGVVVFFKNSPFISLWETICIKFGDQLHGDQDALSALLISNLDKVAPLDYPYHHLFIDNHLTFEQSHIIHYHGDNKKILKNELLILQHRTLHHLRKSPLTVRIT